MKKVGDNLYSQFNHNYIEIVPKSIITGVVPEDRH